MDHQSFLLHDTHTSQTIADGVHGVHVQDFRQGHCQWTAASIGGRGCINTSTCDPVVQCLQDICSNPMIDNLDEGGVLRELLKGIGLVDSANSGFVGV